jgi:hypothetical protein
MKRLSILILVIVIAIVVVTGCFQSTPTEPTTTTPPSNHPPTAFIDLISPSEVALGEMVTLNCHGNDPNGTVVAYKWRSSIDGDLSTSASFRTSSLSVGEHTVYLSRFRMTMEPGQRRLVLRFTL